MQMHIDHIAFRVDDLEKAIQRYVNIHDFKVIQKLDLNILGGQVRAAVLRQGHAKPYIFVSQGLNQKNVVSQWVKEHGNAMHHIAYIVDDIRKEVRRLKAKNIKFTTPGIIGQSPFQQIFSIPDKSTGVIHEVIQRDAADAFFAEKNVEKLINSTSKYSHHKFSHD